MTIPKLHYISEGNSPKEHIKNIQKACTAGAELVELNIKGISEKKLLSIAKEAREVTAYFQTRLLINGDYKIAREVKADGVHLGQDNACPTIARKYVYTWQIIGVTANTLLDCETLLTKEVDYIRLSPFKRSVNTSISDAVLGLNGYTVISESLKTKIPIIGFGGITTKDVTDILETGISRIAVSEEITKNFDSIKIFNQLLRASSTEEMRHTF